MNSALSTSDLMKTFDIGRNTIRLYEERGLLRKPSRTEAGYRKYNQNDVEDLRFILEAKRVGFTLVEIGELLEMMRTEEKITCGTVSNEITAKTRQIDIEIKTLLAKKGFLQNFLKACSANSADNVCDVKQTGFKSSACCG